MIREKCGKLVCLAFSVCAGILWLHHQAQHLSWRRKRPEQLDLIKIINGTRVHTDGFFHKFFKNVYIYSVYYDSRPKAPIIRILALAPYYTKPKFYCKLFYEDGRTDCSSQVKVKKVNPDDRAGKITVWSWMYTCLTHGAGIPHSVSFVDERTCSGDTGRFIVQVIGKTTQKQKKKFATCIAGAAYGIPTGSMVNLVAAIEMNLFLGAEYVFLYNISMNNQLDIIFTYYIQKGKVKVLPWHVPKETRKGLFHHGQNLLLNECFYRNADKVQYLVFTDFDELIMPRGKRSEWHELLLPLKKSPSLKPAALCFRNVFFRMTLQRLSPVPVHLNIFSKITVPIPDFLRSMERTVRPHPFKWRSKCMFSTTKTVLVGVHRLFEALDGHEEIGLPPEMGLNQHYRRLIPGNSVKSMVEDHYHVPKIDIFIKKYIKAYKELKSLGAFHET